ncbi:MAG: terpene cyclase/mutase family protein [Phycisphaerae bacterium]|nr:terpene cyclase/mutase family protein [Phycisphaerae bacterium]
MYRAMILAALPLAVSLSPLLAEEQADVQQVRQAPPQAEQRDAENQELVQNVRRNNADVAAAPAADLETIEVDETVLATARRKGVAWLGEHQAEDGSWGRKYSIAVTACACLSILAAEDEPFADEQGTMLTRAIEFLLSQQKDGRFNKQGHTWTHGQGFATLALAEAYGRSLLCKTQPDLDRKKLREVLARAVAALEQAQTKDGGWYYHPSEHRHEGSTTVTAVQAIVAARNYDIDTKDQVLADGFAYLKKCQNRDGGFDYALDNVETTSSMREGTVANISTLALMKKFDYRVMIRAYQFALKVKPDGISQASWPYYGHFYGAMGMRLLGEELGALRKDIDAYILRSQRYMLSWQQKDGSWPVRRWVKNSGEDDAYAQPSQR